MTNVGDNTGPDRHWDNISHF